MTPIQTIRFLGKMTQINNESYEDTIKRLPDGSVNLVITSPPYNMTKRKGGNADTGRYDVYTDWKTEEEYFDFTMSLFNGLERVVVPDGVVLYNFSYSIENPSLPYKLVTEIEKRSAWRLVDTICWEKNSGLPFPANKYRLSRKWEFVWVFCKSDHIDNFFIDKGVSKVSEKTGQTYYNVHYNYIKAKNNDAPTPELNQATFSSQLVIDLLNIYGGRGERFVVYDPFMGTGTTAVGCLMSDKKPSCIGSEISKAQCEYAENRIKNLLDIQKPL